MSVFNQRHQTTGCGSRFNFQLSFAHSLRGGDNFDPSIAIGADGLPVVSYKSFPVGLGVAHCGNVKCTAGNTLTTVDSAGDVGEGSSIAIGADRLPVVSCFDFTNGDLKVAHCGNVTCTAGNTLTTVDSGGECERNLVGN